MSAMQAFEAEIKRRKRLGDLAMLDAGRETLDEYVTRDVGLTPTSRTWPRARGRPTRAVTAAIAPRLGAVPLRQIDPETVAAFQGDLLRSDVGSAGEPQGDDPPEAILQRAAEGRRIAYNPQRVVRKPRLPLAAQIRPLAPALVEAMRAAAQLRDATIISVLAYAHLRPGEPRELRWRHIRERTLLIDAATTGRRRTAGLLAALAADLAAWRDASGDPPAALPVFPDSEEACGRPMP